MKSVLKSEGSAEVKKTVESRLTVLREEAIRAKLVAEQEAAATAAREARPGLLGRLFI